MLRGAHGWGRGISSAFALDISCLAQPLQPPHAFLHPPPTLMLLEGLQSLPWPGSHGEAESPLTLECQPVRELTPPRIRLDPKLLRKNADNPTAPSSSPLCPLSSFAGPGNVQSCLPSRALKICCTKKGGDEDFETF